MFDHAPVHLSSVTAALAGLTALIVLAGCTAVTAPPVALERESASSPSVSSSTGNALRMVVLGDSIPYNSSDDCPGCTGFVDRYAKDLGAELHRPVEVSNLSQHTGLTLPDLLAELPTFEQAIAAADVIVIGVAHNSFVLNSDKPCGATFDETTNKMSDWSMFTEQCAVNSAEKYRSQYEKLYSSVVGYRAGKPTIYRTINRYNDWIGWKDAHLTKDQQHRTTVMTDAWNKMLCAAANANSFVCSDIYHAFNGPRGDKPSGVLLGGDYTHPSDQGNAVIAKVLLAEGVAPLG